MSELPQCNECHQTCERCTLPCRACGGEGWVPVKQPFSIKDLLVTHQRCARCDGQKREPILRPDPSEAGEVAS